MNVLILIYAIIAAVVFVTLIAATFIGGYDLKIIEPAACSILWLFVLLGILAAFAVNMIKESIVKINEK